MKIKGMVTGVYKNAVKQIANKLSASALVLIYHRVVDLPLDSQLLAVTPQNFAAQMDILKEHYHVLLIDEFFHYLSAKKPFPPRSVLITFDDGYYDNFTYALPILEAAGQQAIFHVATAAIGTQKEFWWDVLENIFLKTPVLPPTLKIHIKNRQLTFPTRTLADKQHTYQQLHPLLKYLYPSLREEKISSLLDWAGVKEGAEENRVMTEAELVALSKSASAIIGAHTHSHPVLSGLNFEDQLNEIATSKDILEAITGKSIKYFSYPFGTKTDYNSNSIKIMKDLHFDMAFSNFPKLSYSWTSQYEIPRFLVRNWRNDEFKEKVCDIF